MSKFGKYQRAIVVAIGIEVFLILGLLVLGSFTQPTWVTGNEKYIALIILGQFLIVVSIISFVTGIAAGMRHRIPSSTTLDTSELIYMFQHPEDRKGLVIFEGIIARITAIT
ncbi:hypothetical protein KC717_02255, partial [Candidatus Dojkabacteria bacterium]|nr:hypothetical protein [Candidatus Dojkabacteria bacterium]